MIWFIFAMTAIGTVILGLVVWRTKWRASVNDLDDSGSLGGGLIVGSGFFLAGSLYAILSSKDGVPTFWVWFGGILVGLVCLGILKVIVLKRHRIWGLIMKGGEKGARVEGTKPFGVPLYTKIAKDPAVRLTEVVNKRTEEEVRDV